MLEKRCHERFDIEITSHLFFSRNSGPPEHKEVVTRNLSSSGAFFITSDILPLGTQLQIEFFLPISKLQKPNGNDSRIQCVGKVIRQEPEGVAVCFDKGCSIAPVDIRPN